jgi:hypothetical protein
MPGGANLFYINQYHNKIERAVVAWLIEDSQEREFLDVKSVPWTGVGMFGPCEGGYRGEYVERRLKV